MPRFRLCARWGMLNFSRFGAGDGQMFLLLTKYNQLGSRVEIGRPGQRSSRRSRTIPAKLRRALQFRDGGCRYPGCTNTRYVEAHHVVHRARGGPTTLENLVLLCRRHHTYVHEWGFRVEAGSGPGHFRFFNRRGVEIQAELIEFSGTLQICMTQN
jgi:HNH endonuclease